MDVVGLTRREQHACEPHRLQLCEGRLDQSPTQATTALVEVDVCVDVPSPPPVPYSGGC